MDKPCGKKLCGQAPWTGTCCEEFGDFGINGLSLFFALVDDSFVKSLVPHLLDAAPRNPSSCFNSSLRQFRPLLFARLSNGSIFDRHRVMTTPTSRGAMTSLLNGPLESERERQTEKRERERQRETERREREETEREETSVDQKQEFSRRRRPMEISQIPLESFCTCSCDNRALLMQQFLSFVVFCFSSFLPSGSMPRRRWTRVPRRAAGRLDSGRRRELCGRRRRVRRGAEPVMIVARNSCILRLLHAARGSNF